MVFQVPPDPRSRTGAAQRPTAAEPAAAAVRPGSSGPPVVHLRGELDLATLASTRAALRRCTATGALRVVVVTSDVTFADCSGLRPLRETAAALAVRGGCVELHSPSDSVLRLVRMCGAGPGLVLHESR